MEKGNTDYDVIIIGHGPAGIAASIYLSRARLKVVVMGKRKQTQLQDAYFIENYFGFTDGIAGPELLAKGERQAKKFGVEFMESEVVDVQKRKSFFTVRDASGKSYACKYVLIACGMPRQKAGIEGEDHFAQKGVHYSAEADGPFYSGQPVVVVGKGNHAAETAYDLATFSSDITLVTHNGAANFSEYLLTRLRRRKVRIVEGKVKAITGSDHVEHVVLEQGEDIACTGVFIATGQTNALDFASNLGLKTQKNLLVVDTHNQTTVPGVYAAGNCVTTVRQIAKNIGDGCNAAINIIKTLERKDLYVDYGNLYGEAVKGGST